MELPGPFAAGDDPSGMHGANRLGGNGVANSTVFGGAAGDVMPAWPAKNGLLRAPNEDGLQAEAERAQHPLPAETRGPQLYEGRRPATMRRFGETYDKMQEVI
jgi:succinate dehydrogenase/fumarate reductase flavoprotein subunit